MQTSLVSTAASLTAAAPLASTSIKADRPQQLQSVTVYFRGRKMVLMQRPQRRLSVLLRQMLRRSMLNLFGRLSAKLAAPVKRVLSAGALCAMALASVTTAYATATVDQLPINTLPTDPKVISGKVGFDNSTVNQLNVGIGSNKAVINWNSFSIGSAAGVDFHFANAGSSSSVLNRVTGNDPSQIMGNLTSNGKVFLINSAGILVGKNAKVDVAGFVASTLNISNRDFRHGKLHFQNRRGVAAGNVEIQEDGSIKTAEGGSVYLIGANVENGGVITSPKGEVLLAAGKSVDLVDTGTPGVKINVKGKEGKITNLGQIMAATGTIGFGAALIDNGGMLNASSVDKAGGRIFLRASKDLTTSETSSINADGTTGGSVVLYADDTARIDGDVSVLGNVDGAGGNGGYVETSGKRQLGVMYKPRIGRGGEWYIDPSNIDIVQSGGLLGGILQGVISIITGSGPSSSVLASTITDLLNDGTSVRIVTGDINSGGGGAGDITVHTNIVTSGATGPATLILDAAHNINILDNVTIGDGGQANGLRLEMVAGYTESGGVITPNHGGAIQASNATIRVGGGFEAHAASYGMTGGSLTSSGAFNMDAPLTTNVGATITLNDAVGTATFKDATLNGGSTLAVNNSTATLDTITLIGAGTNVASTDSTLTIGTTVLNSSTSLNAAGSTVSLGTATVNGATLTFDNSTATLAATALDNASALTVKNSSQVTLTGDITGAAKLNIGANASDGAGLNAGAHSVTVGELHQKGGSLADTGAGTLTVNGVVDQSGGAINFHAVNLTQTSGTLAVGKITATTLNLLASAGAIGQVGALSAGELNATATGGITLTNASNAVGAFAGHNSGSGAISFNDTGNLALAVIDNGNRDVTIGTTGSVSQTGAVTANHLSVTADGGINLSNSGNLVAEFSADNAGAGNVTLVNNGDVMLDTVNNSAAGGNIAVTATGQIGLNGAVTTANQVSLTSTLSNVQQANNIYGVTAASLVAEAKSGIALGSVNNVAAFSAANHISGDILLNNNQASGSAMTLGTVNQSATSATHDVTINSGGTITGSGTVTNAGGAVNIDSQSGSIELGGVTAATVTITASQGAITQNGAVTATTLHTESGGATTLGNTGNSIRNFSGNSGGDLTLKDRSGQSLTLGDINSAGHSVTIDTDSTLLQNVNTITAAALSVTTHGGFNLNGDNAVGAFSAVNTGGSNVAFHNTANLSVGPVSNDQGYVTINTTGDLSTTGLVSALNEVALGAHGSMTIGAAGIEGDSINLSTSTGGMQLNGALTADDHVTLSSGAGIVQNGGVITTNQLSTVAHADTDLDSTGNDIRNFSATSDTGHIHLHNTGALATVGSMTVGAGKDVDLTTTGNLTTGGQITASTINLTSGGDIAVNSQLTASGSASLRATGRITQTVGILAAALNATAGTGMTLDSANSVNSFSASNSISGDIAFTNDKSLTLGAIDNSLGHVIIDTQGTLSSTVGISASGLDVSAVGDIGLSGVNDVRNFSAHSNSGSVELNNTGSLTLGAITTPLGAVHIETTGGLTVAGAGITAQNDVALTSDDSDLTINAQISAGGLGVALSAEHGAIAQDPSSGGIATNALDAKALTGIALNSLDNHIQEFTARNGAVINNDVGFSLDHNAAGDISLTNASNLLALDGTVKNEAVGGSVSIVNSGTITGTPVHDGGGNVTNGTFADGNVTLTSQTGNVNLAKIVATNLDVNASAGAINQDLSNVDVLTVSGTMTAHARDGIAINNHANVTGLNHIAHFSATNTGSGGISLNNSGALLTLGTIDNGARGVTIVTDGNLLQDGGITTAALDVTAAGGINLDSNVNHIGSFAASSPTGNIDLVDNGDLVLGALTAPSGAVNVFTDDGGITQTGAISAISLVAGNSGGSAIVLDNAGNSFTAFSGNASGDMTVKTSGALAIGDTTAGNLSVTAQNNISMTGDIDAADGNVALTSALGSVTLGDVTAGDMTVLAGQGTVGQNSDAMLAVSGELHVEAKNGITLDTADANQVGTFSASNSDSGDIAFVNHSDTGNVLTLGKIDNAHGHVIIQNNLGVIQARGANTGITAAALDVTAAGGITLDASTNNVDAFTARNDTSGDIALTNTASALNLNGTIRNNAVGGNVTIDNTGDINGTATHNMADGSVTNGTFADGKVTLIARASNAAAGNVKLAQIQAANLEVNADGAITQEGSNAVILNISGTMTAHAKTGIALNGNSNATIHNHIANFDATNNGSGDITLYNEGVGNKLIAISNNGGNVLVDNIGALETVNAISVPNGSVTLTAHSPLTIGAGGISAGTGINLSAGDGSLPTDVLTLNGELQSTSGGISLVYYSVTTSTPPTNPPTDPVTNPPTNPSTDPVTTGQDKDKENAVNAIAPVVDRNLDANAGEANPNLPAVTTPVTTTASSGSNNGNGNQTAGGSDGEFGGAKDDGKGGKGDKSNMSAPMCT